MIQPPFASYPGAIQIKRAISAVAKAGVAIGSIEISQTGAIRVFAVGSVGEDAPNDFDEWDRKGAL